MERLEAGILGDAEDRFDVIFRFLYSLDEGTLTGVEDIDAAPLEEEDVGNLTASDDVSIVLKRHHGISRYPDEEVCSLCLELWD